MKKTYYLTEKNKNTRWRRGMMEKIVKSCGECPFLRYDSGDYYCELKPAFDDSLGYRIDKKIIHPLCPEKGAFIITTKKIEDDKS